jgi:hypothetical protein
LMALARFESGLCECGFHESLTSDRANVFQPEFQTCLVCAGVERYARVQADADRAAMKVHGDDPPAVTPRPTDGRRLFVRRLSEVEVEQMRAKRPASASVRG